MVSRVPATATMISDIRINMMIAGDHWSLILISNTKINHLILTQLIVYYLSI